MNLASKLVLALACQSSAARAVENSNTAFVDQLEAVALRGSQGTKDPQCHQPEGGCRLAYLKHVWNPDGGECHGQCYCQWDNKKSNGPERYVCTTGDFGEDTEEELLV